MIKRTLVGYDGSESSQRAFRFALDIMRATSGHVHVLSVLQVTGGGGDVGATMMTDEGDDHTRELKAELAALAPDDGELYDIEVVYGSPGDAILSQVREHGAEHVVIGHTGRGALLRWLVGSVSSDIIARSHVPVTVVR